MMLRFNLLLKRELDVRLLMTLSSSFHSLTPITDKVRDFSRVLWVILMNWLICLWGYLEVLMWKYFWMFFGICFRKIFCISIAVLNLTRSENFKIFSFLNSGVVCSILLTLHIILIAFFCCIFTCCRFVLYVFPQISEQ